MNSARSGATARIGLFAVVLAASVLCSSGCRPSVNASATTADPTLPGAPWFADVTEEVGLDFVHDAGPVGRLFMPQALGSGAAVFDVDGDGLLDLYLLHNGGPDGKTNRLYRQQPGGRFQDVSQGSGLDFAGYNMGVAIGDVNNDGHPDVVVTQYAGLRLLLNNGDGKSFRDVTDAAGLRNPAWGMSAAFLDYDRDGWLDLVIANYVDLDPTWRCTSRSGVADYCPPNTFPGRAAKLFRNVGRQPAGAVRFEDVTIAAGLGRLAGPGLGVCCADFDGDGWTDIFIANDGQPNRLWINRHDGTFGEEAVKRGVAYNAMAATEAGMGVALGDLDGDGLADLFVTHLTEETNTLWRQQPRGLFQDRTVALGAAGPGARGTGFGVVLQDFDQDGALDVAVANGRVARSSEPPVHALGPHWGLYAEKNLLLANDGKGRLHSVAAANAAFCGTPNVGRGLAWGDVDGDGAPDLLVTTAGGRARLYRNVATPRGHWLLVRAFDPDRRRDAYGAEVRVQAGGHTWLRHIGPTSSYLCSNDLRAHFGLGSAERVEAIDVRWPDGTNERFAGGAADRVVLLHKGKGVRPPG